MSVVYHPLAQREVLHATAWYAQRSIDAAIRFADELMRTETKVQSSPEAGPQYFRGTRFYRLRRFPYLMIYRIGKGNIEVIAIAHAKRRPHYWSRRLR